MNMTAQRKGDIAVAKAISSFTLAGFDVSLPITESAQYDLIVDTEGTLYRVQVKYSTRVDVVDLRRIHSNSKGYQVKFYGKNDFDWLFVYRADINSEFLIEFVPETHYISLKGYEFATFLEKFGG